MKTEDSEKSIKKKIKQTNKQKTKQARKNKKMVITITVNKMKIKSMTRSVFNIFKHHYDTIFCFDLPSFGIIIVPT